VDDAVCMEVTKGLDKLCNIVSCQFLAAEEKKRGEEGERKRCTSITSQWQSALALLLLSAWSGVPLESR